MNGILYVLKTGCAWADMPREYGSPTTCWRRLDAWYSDGTQERLWRSLLNQYFWTAASFQLKKVTGVGKTKVGKGSKVMVVADENGLPIGLPVNSAQADEVKLAPLALANRTRSTTAWQTAHASQGVDC
jgi:transposase